MKAIPLRWAIGTLVGSVALGVAACVALTTAETRRVHRLVPQDGKLVDIEGEQLHCSTGSPAKPQGQGLQAATIRHLAG